MLRRIGVVALLMLIPAVCAEAQAVRVPVPTRLVQSYTELERRLAGALDQRDSGEVDKLVAPDFELRSAAHPGTPTPRADWLGQSFKEPGGPSTIEQMAVHDYGSIRVVSFLWKKGGGAARDVMVVDVWMASGETSVLKVRYAAIAAGGNVPGDAPPAPFNKRF
jgi:hypothetical protein